MLDESKVMCLDAIEVGRRIRDARKRKKIKVIDLAMQIGLSTDQYARIESGKSVCGLNNIYLISQYLEVSVDYLLSGKEMAEEMPHVWNILNGKSKKDVERARKVLEAMFS